MEITIGQVSGIIAAAIFLIQHIFPNALILILVGVLRNQHTAITWSVVQRQLFSSLWPSVLRSDASGGNGVNTSVRLVSLLNPLGLMLVGIAAVVTPLGLYDAIVPSASEQSIPFLYLHDSGSFGTGTPAQNSSIPFTRICNLDGSGYVPCPGSKNQVDLIYDDAGDVTSENIIGTYDVNVPQNTIDLFQSGLKDLPETVSSFFDIRDRQYTSTSANALNDGAPYIVDSYRYLESLVLNNRIEAVQGLIVDTINGGVGFRNHTVPSGISQAAKWVEDLLWIEPITECVNTNISIEFTTPADGFGSMKNITLVDEGGFANLIQEYPEFALEDNQVNPKLRERAYKAAWLMNVYNMLIMNVTRPNPDVFGYLNSHVGQRFPLDDDFTSSATALLGITLDSTYEGLLDIDGNTLHTVNNTFTNQTETKGLYSNPFNVTSHNFSDISVLCQGEGGQDYANSTNIAVACGVFYGAAQRVDGVQTLLFEPNITWRRPVYSCASLNKASIKTVTFQYNVTQGNDLKSLSILDVADKTYASNDDMPLWGMEQPDPPMTLVDITPIWGFVSAENANAPNLTTKRAAELYIPGYTALASISPGTPGYQYMPGSNMLMNVLANLYTVGQQTANIAADYTGGGSLNMFLRWQELSANISTVPTILHLIWADSLANGIQGTRGWGSTDNAGGSGYTKRDVGSSGSGTLVPVQVFSKRIKYHLPYAIPAVIALALFAIVLLGAMCFMLFGNGPKRVRHYLQHLSVGRILASEQYPGQSSMTAPTKLWRAQVGKHMVSIGHERGPMIGPTAYNGAYGPAQHNTFMRGEKTGPATTTAVESYPMSPLGRVPQGYERVASAEQDRLMAR